MKNNLSKALVTLVALGAASQAQAYTYSFTNHTNSQVAIGMKYQGINEPLEQRVVPPHERRQFRPGDPDITSRKAGFIVDKFYYMQEPSFSVWFKRNGPFNPNNIQQAPWRALSLTWVSSDKYDAAIELAEALGGVTEAATKAGIKAGAAYATGGASLAADAGKEAVAAAAKKIASADAAKEIAASDYNLWKILCCYR